MSGEPKGVIGCLVASWILLFSGAQSAIYTLESPFTYYLISNSYQELCLTSRYSYLYSESADGLKMSRHGGAKAIL